MNSIHELTQAVDGFAARKRKMESAIKAEQHELQAAANAMFSKLPQEQINENWERIQEILEGL